MYDFSDVVSDATVDPGTNILIAGPPLTGKRTLALELLATGTEQGEGTIAVTTKDAARQIVEEYSEFVGDVAGSEFAIVDAVTRQQGEDGELDRDWIEYASSPVDMTGMGIRLSELLEEFHENRGLEQNRILLYSLSTLLIYSDLQAVFQFVHVLTGRVDNADALGVYVVDSTAHDEQTLNTLNHLFDGIVHVERPKGGGEPKTRLEGL